MMKCRICRNEATSHIVFQRGQASRPGYLATETEVSFESDRISSFAYYCASKGLHLKKRGVVDLCGACLYASQTVKNQAAG